MPHITHTSARKTAHIQGAKKATVHATKMSKKSVHERSIEPPSWAAPRPALPGSPPLLRRRGGRPARPSRAADADGHVHDDVGRGGAAPRGRPMRRSSTEPAAAKEPKKSSEPTSFTVRARRRSPIRRAPPAARSAAKAVSEARLGGVICHALAHRGASGKKS